jgi:hypothetical protein
MARARKLIEGKTYGKYHVLEFAGYKTGKRRGTFYYVMDMTNGKKSIYRQDLLPIIEKYYQITLKNIKAIEEYKKKHNLK